MQLTPWLLDNKTWEYGVRVGRHRTTSSLWQLRIKLAAVKFKTWTMDPIDYWPIKSCKSYVVREKHNATGEMKRHVCFKHEKLVLRCPSSRSENWAFPTGILRKQILIIGTRLGRNPLFTLKREYGTQKRTYGRWYSEEKKGKAFKQCFHHVFQHLSQFRLGLSRLTQRFRGSASRRQGLECCQIFHHFPTPWRSKLASTCLQEFNPKNCQQLHQQEIWRIWKMVKPC